jgi:hypothetical protein
VIRNGVLTITTPTAAKKTAEPFRRIGNCYWAILAAWIGGVAGRFFYVTRGEEARETRSQT